MKKRLPANPRKNWKVIHERLKQDDAPSLVAYRHDQDRIEAVRLGWPPGTTSREAAILGIIYNLGQASAAEIASKIGVSGSWNSELARRLKRLVKNERGISSTRSIKFLIAETQKKDGQHRLVYELHPDLKRFHAIRIDEMEKLGENHEDPVGL
jgi:DNA-binding MarR family transcriptional regulator